jgi:2-hydroxy-3-keto-5-methylthiopentenyl-1-phosphate phosphatase
VTIAGRNAGEGGRSLVLDFDGTITEIDLLDEVARRFGDPAVYQEVEDQLLAGEITLRECIEREFEPVQAPVDEVVGWALEEVRIRPGLGELVDLARARGWSALVLSSGFHELIEPILAREEIDLAVHANRLASNQEGWHVVWRDGRICPVCGQACKRASLPEGEVVYVGDGYSDRCAALASNRIFAAHGLARYLEEQGRPYDPFGDFLDVVRTLEG